MENKDAATFPIPEQFSETGLTKREYFAGLAMQGLITADIEFGGNKAELGKQSVQIADELLKQLEVK